MLRSELVYGVVAIVKRAAASLTCTRRSLTDEIGEQFGA
jgi:hypothetical protein